MREVINKEFVHLKIHTQYSICEGALRTADLAKYCKNNKVKAVGLCDSNNLCGALEFSESIAKSKTQPIIGTQININYKGHFGKLPLFAKSLEGYKNLIKLSSKSFLEIKENEDPHCSIDEIEKNFEGIIILSGSFDGLFGKLFFKNLNHEILLLFKRLKLTFKDNFYVEIQRHDDDGEKLYEKFLLSVSDKLDLPILATHEVYYLDKDMHEAHDALMCIGSKTYINEKNRIKYTDQHYFKTDSEMADLFFDLPEALENNYNLPFRCNFRPTYSKPVLPDISSEKGGNADNILIKDSEEGLISKFENIFKVSKSNLFSDK